MFFQKIIKGISGLSSKEALHILESGILCNWWRNANKISIQDKKTQLIQPNIDLHLNHYEASLPVGHWLKHLGSTYGDVSPFISTTAGATQIDEFARKNVLHGNYTRYVLIIITTF